MNPQINYYNHYNACTLITITVNFSTFQDFQTYLQHTFCYTSTLSETPKVPRINDENVLQEHNKSMKGKIIMCKQTVG